MIPLLWGLPILVKDPKVLINSPNVHYTPMFAQYQIEFLTFRNSTSN